MSFFFLSTTRTERKKELKKAEGLLPRWFHLLIYMCKISFKRRQCSQRDWVELRNGVAAAVGGGVGKLQQHANFCTCAQIWRHRWVPDYTVSSGGAAVRMEEVFISAGF